MQPGDCVAVNLDEEGHLILTPKKMIDSSQAYFWSENWQKGEHQADKDIYE
jgi:hypothetical protein